MKILYGLDIPSGSWFDVYTKSTRCWWESFRLLKPLVIFGYAIRLVRSSRAVLGQRGHVATKKFKH